jgi:hypothetical protein
MPRFITLFVIALGAAFFSKVAGLQKDSDFTEREESNQVYELGAGANIEVRGINGSVDVTTYDGSAAEVHIVRLARDRKDLQYRKVIVEHEPGRLIIRGQSDESHRANVRQQVTLKLPRRVELSVAGINGRVRIGEIGGTAKLTGINGEARAERLMGHLIMSGVNGRAIAAVSELDGRGISVSGINGDLELRLQDDVSADIEISGINGKIHSELPMVIVGQMGPSRLRGKVGQGGAPITLSSCAILGRVCSP